MSDFQTKTREDYEKRGYIVLNTIRLSKNGYPDLIAFKDGKSIFIECKEKNDTLKPLQRYRINELIKEGFEAFCLQKGKGIIYPEKK